MFLRNSPFAYTKQMQFAFNLTRYITIQPFTHPGCICQVYNARTMKENTLTKLMVALALLFVANAASAQGRIIRNQGFYYTIEANAGYGIGTKTDYILADIDNDYTPYQIGVKASANLFLTDHISFGGGMGYTRFKSPDMNTIPVTVNLKYFTGKPAQSPFFYAEGGYGIRANHKKQNKGTVYEFGIGYRHRLQNRHNFVMFKLGYSRFKTNEWIWDRENLYDAEFVNPKWYYLDRPAIGFSICFYHSTRY